MIITNLTHDKILSRQTFPTFVDSWNDMQSRVAHLKGDADVNPESGKITVDYTDDTHPVIRLSKNISDGGGGDGYPGCFEIDFEGDTFRNPFVQVGNKILSCDSVLGVTGLEGSIVCVQLDCSGETEGTPQMTKVSSMEELQQKQTDASKIYCPIYWLDESGKVICDFRKGCIMPKFEILDNEDYTED